MTYVTEKSLWSVNWLKLVIIFECVEQHYLEFFRVRIFPTEYRKHYSKYLYSLYGRENTDQKKLQIQTFLTQCKVQR